MSILIILCQLSWFCHVIEMTELPKYKFPTQEQIEMAYRMWGGPSKGEPKLTPEDLRIKFTFRPDLSSGIMNCDPIQIVPAREIARFMPHNIIIVDEGKAIVTINTKTGKVKLNGNPNKAARIFWKAVERMYGK